MTETTLPRSTPDSRAAALTMWENQVPCFFQLVEPSCDRTAVVLAWFSHEETAPPECPGPDPWPLCPEHQQAVRRGNDPFWCAWFRTDPMKCLCGTPIRLVRFEPL